MFEILYFDTSVMRQCNLYTSSFIFEECDWTLDTGGKRADYSFILGYSVSMVTFKNGTSSVA